MNDLELRKLQITELEILIDFHNFCKDNNLTYYLIGGALLGAMRHQCFIPWDDDIDVAMPRNDYERLKTEYISSEKYFLQNADSDPLFARGIQKIRRNGTMVVEEITKNVDIHHGIYIDIFPIDYVNTAGKVKMGLRARTIRFYLSLRAIKSGYRGSRYRGLKSIIQALCPINVASIDHRLDVLCTRENHLSRRYAVLWLHNYSWNRQLHDPKIFGEAGTCMFEGQQFSAPEDAHAFLAKVLGTEYMLEPPVEKRRNPHNYVKICFD